MTKIETYRHGKEGYSPFLIRPKWQIAQLNYSQESRLENIIRLDVHYQTDEAFFLIQGIVILIGASINNDVIEYDIQKLKPGVTYNIPANMWHNIVMSEDAQVLIVENENTHLGDYEFYYLSDQQKAELTILVQKETNKPQ